jgi:relaxase-like protein
MIAEIVRGDGMPDLISYLFGPGRHNEHVDQHLVAGYADAVFTAPDRLWKSEPGVQRQVQKEARDLGWQVEYPRSRWGTEVPRGYVWHCSLSIRSDEGQLTDTQWAEAAHAMIDALGFSGADGKAPCRWVAVRHGPSTEGNDHIHIAVNLAREDGTKASTWNDYRKAGAACAGLEERFGLQHVPGRLTGRSVPEPSRADQEISAARGENEPLRTRLERKVRACSAAARSEAHFIALARAHGLLIRPRYDTSDRTRVTGYAVADRDGRHAYSSRTGTRGPVWFGGGKLASDLALPRLRERWQSDATATTMEALAAWSASTSIAPGPRRHLRTSGERTSVTDNDYAISAMAGVLAAAATGIEGSDPGPLSRAARHLARAAQHQPPPAPATPGVLRTMADAFLTIASAGTDAGALILVNEVALLADACAARAATSTARREAQRASVLVQASVAALTDAASTQAPATLTTSTRGTAMSEPTHEEDFLRHLTQAGVVAARVARIRFSGPGLAADIARLRAAGYSEQTRHDDLLRQLLGEQRWAAYAADPARIVAAAAITDGDRAGYDMPSLLTKVVHQRRWETDAQSPSQSVARVLYYRVTREMARTLPEAASASSRHQAITRTGRTAAGQGSPPVLLPQHEGRLRELLGEHRWRQYAADPRQRAVAELITRAHHDGRDVDALLTNAVTSRPFEDDPVSPARNIADVLHYRLQRELSNPAPNESRAAPQLPGQVADVLAHGNAPAGARPPSPRTDPAAPQSPLSTRTAGRSSDERSSR